MLKLSVSDGKDVDTVCWNYRLRSENKYEKLGQKSSKLRCKQEARTQSQVLTTLPYSFTSFKP
jgi:hypothetical protein